MRPCYLASVMYGRQSALWSEFSLGTYAAHLGSDPERNTDSIVQAETTANC
jgi:hypothetical protein